MATIHAQRPSDDSRTATEMPSPGEVTEDQDGIGIESIVARLEQASQGGPGAQKLEVLARDRRAEDVKDRVLIL
jgi:hypothetical protein